MSYKTRMCYVVMREHKTNDPNTGPEWDKIPVAVFFDEETASGNAEGYNLEFEERGINGITFYVAVTAAFE